jgi:putative phage-type endonuclease
LPAGGGVINENNKAGGDEMTNEQLLARRTGIGGSDAPGVCGVSTWSTPYQIWLDKRGEVEPREDDDRMYWGRAVEPIIRSRYQTETGRQVQVPKLMRHPNYDWMIGNLDGITSDGRVLEIKTAESDRDWGEEGTNVIPDPYMIQVQHYMTVTNLPIADVAVLFRGNDFRIYEVPADSELQVMLIDREADFWELVKKGIPPEPTSLSDVKQRWGKFSQPIQVQTNELVSNALNRLKEIKAFRDEEESLVALIQAHMKEADTLVDGDRVLVTLKAQKGAKRIDTKMLEAEMPETYKKYQKQGDPFRRFLIK